MTISPHPVPRTRDESGQDQSEGAAQLDPAVAFQRAVDESLAGCLRALGLSPEDVAAAVSGMQPLTAQQSLTARNAKVQVVLD